MILRQLFDRETYTYSYIIGDSATRKAAIIDPVIEHVEMYIQLLKQLDLTLAFALDTHVHADHITALGQLRERTQCRTFIGNAGDIACADEGLVDGQIIEIGRIKINVIYTPGHTEDSYCFYVVNGEGRYLFSGDTLLIRGSGRTDFQNGNPGDLYDSLHQKLMCLPEDTVVLPGHDYKGWTVSSIGEERNNNPRLQIKDKQEFIQFMNNLKLPNPKWMDIAVPANRACGKN